MCLDNRNKMFGPDLSTQLNSGGFGKDDFTTIVLTTRTKLVNPDTTWNGAA